MILNDLSAVSLSASVALKVKLYVVDAVGDGAVPVIAPVLEFKVKFIVAAGVLAFDVNTLVVSLNAIVLSDEASTSNDTDAPAATLPKDPAPVEKDGAGLRALMPWIYKKKLIDSDKN